MFCIWHNLVVIPSCTAFSSPWFESIIFCFKSKILTLLNAISSVNSFISSSHSPVGHSVSLFLHGRGLHLQALLQVDPNLWQLQHFVLQLIPLKLHFVAPLELCSTPFSEGGLWFSSFFVFSYIQEFFCKWGSSSVPSASTSKSKSSWSSGKSWNNILFFHNFHCFPWWIYISNCFLKLYLEEAYGKSWR